MFIRNSRIFKKNLHFSHSRSLKVCFLEKFNWQNKSTFHCISDIPDWISLKRINHRQIMKTFFASIKKLDSYDSSFRLISFLIRIHDPLPFDSWSFRNMGSFRQINFSCIIFHIFLGSSIILKMKKCLFYQIIETKFTF